MSKEGSLAWPALRTTLVGSYPVPTWLRAAPSQEGLHDAIATVLALQRRLGIDLPTDGELSRFDINHPETNGMIEYFVRPLGGVRSAITRSDLARMQTVPHLKFRRQPAGVVVGEVSEGSLDLVSVYQTTRRLADGQVKFTVTSPYMLARTLLDEHYGDLRSLAFALADVLAAQIREIDADVIQVDEASVPGQPQDSGLAAEVINRLLDAVPRVPAVHLCFGNYSGQRVHAGRMREMAQFLGALHAHHIVLETTRHEPEDLRVLGQAANVRFGIGVIDVKDTQVETPDQVAARIERAADCLGGAERIEYVHPDCGLYVMPRSIADNKIAALVQGRDQYLGY
ncbi:MAG TPA: cobalamin-independent methionine synthase II family protein [Pseudonocardia sp.]|uniref:cobalamin-independent methionine synthase II family protein n=1 Tax=Pseudonocardia sp. TaxID=60912 RepID=UPI002C61C698|nr:cobalamin-independent methionine synthase II family protein [Pseudonocardia sp.]HTF48280.1 cobalamin-independent methionine synthase II family protein [Pseudonocardia sp.]